MRSRRLAARFFVMLFVSTAIAHHIYRDEGRWHDAGKAVFLQHQSERFDHFMETPSAGHFLGFIVVCMLMFLLYEALAFGAGEFLTRLAPARHQEK